MLTTTSVKVIGMPDISGWSQVYEFTPTEPDKFSARGSLFTVIATKKADGAGISAITTGRELISRFQEAYFGDLTLRPFNALKMAVEKVTGEFKSLWGNVEIAACGIVGGVVYSVATGGAEVAICRRGALGTILKSTGESVITASGYPQKGDVILLATKGFFEANPQDSIKSALTGDAFNTTAGIFDSKRLSGSQAASVIKFDEPIFTQTVQETKDELPSPVRPHNANLITNLGKKLASTLQQFIKIIPQKDIYVNQMGEPEIGSQNKKLTFSVAIILLLLLVISIAFGIGQKRVNDAKGRYQSILTIAQKEVDDAISLASTSPDRSRELFADSEQKLAQITSMNVKDPKVEALRKKIEDSRGAILGEYLVSPDQFLDLSLLSSGFKGDSISYSGGSVFVFDRSGKRVVSVAISTKKSKVVAGPSVIEDASDAAAYQNRVFVLASDGVYEVGQTKNKVIDKSWAGDALIKAFAGNIYVLDKAGNGIYRYAGNGSTFGDKQNWLAAGTKVDFSDVKQFVIDGSMYTLFPNSKIFKFSLGSAQNFKISGVIPEIGTVDAIFAGEDNQNIYLLDRAGKRVVVTDKKGKYLAQYLNDQIGSAINLVVSEAEKKIILLTGEKLLSIELKQQ